MLSKESAYKQMLQWAAWGVVSFFIVVTAEAQSTLGTFVGTVHDPSGAVVGATVQVINKGTSAERSVRTDASGSYTIVNVDPGTYDVVFEAPGFQRISYTDVALTARETVRGVALGGPVVLPHIYNGHNKTFFYAIYEGLRLAQQTVLVESVPSLALRQGDLSYYDGPITTGGGTAPLPNNQIPASMISPAAKAVLQNLFPLPNAVGPNPVTNNFVDN